MDRSLVTAAEVDGTTRYNLLETLRQYGRDRSTERGTTTAIRDRHLDWLKRLCGEGSAKLQIADRDWMRRADLELANIRVGLDWAATDRARAATGLTVINALRRYWFIRTLMAEGARWIQRLLDAAVDLDPRVEASARSYLGFFLLESGDNDAALPPLRTALSLARRLDDPVQTTRALHYLSRAGFDRLPPEEVIAMIEEGHTIAAESGDALHQVLHGIIGACWHLGHSDPDTTQEYGRAFCEAYLDSASPQIGSHTHEIAAWLALERGDLEASRADLAAAFEQYRGLANAGCTCHALESLAWWLAAATQLDGARQVLAGARHLREINHAPRAPYEAHPYNAVHDLLDQRPADAPPELPFGDLDAGIDYAISILASPERG